MASGFVYADTSKGLYKLFHKSHFALAGLVPATLALPSDGFPAKLADVGLAAVLPLHSHVAMNSGEWNSTQRARSRSEIKSCCFNGVGTRVWVQLRKSCCAHPRSTCTLWVWESLPPGCALDAWSKPLSRTSPTNSGDRLRSEGSAAPSQGRRNWTLGRHIHWVDEALSHRRRHWRDREENLGWSAESLKPLSAMTALVFLP